MSFSHSREENKHFKKQYNIVFYFFSTVSGCMTHSRYMRKLS